MFNPSCWLSIHKSQFRFDSKSFGRDDDTRRRNNHFLFHGSAVDGTGCTCLANCYFFQDSSGFSVLLAFLMLAFAVLSAHLRPSCAPVPGGVRSLIAESLLLKHQILILNRSRKRSPNLHASDRILAGLMALLVRPTRLLRSAIVLKLSTLLALHKSMSKGKYRSCSPRIAAGSPARKVRAQNSSVRSSK